MSLESRWPSVYEQLWQAGQAAERHLRDVADIEFTIDRGRLFVTQMRRGRAPPLAKMRVQLRLLTAGVIAPEEILERICPADVAAFLRPEIADKTRLKPLGKGLGASGGAASGRIAFSPSGTTRLGPAKHPSILI